MALQRRYVLWPLVACAVAFAWLASTSEAHANGPMGREAGLGLILGEPTGLTGKFWLDPASAVDAHLSFDFSDDAFALVADYLLHFNVFNINSASVDLPVYVGGGAKLSYRDRNNKDDDDNLGVGVRFPVGLSLLLTKAPLEFFGELALGMRIIPGTRADLDGGIGVRYYF